MPPPSSLTTAHQRTFEILFRNPPASNLSWREVHALLRQLGEVEEEPNGEFKVTRHGQNLVLPSPHTKDVSSQDELMQLRDFLTRSAVSLPEETGPAACWLLVIDHHEARVFHSKMHGTEAEQIRPHQTDDAISHVHSFDGFSRGQEKPATHSYFGPVADALKDAHQILIFGGGTGTAKEMDLFVAWLHLHRPSLASRIVGTLIVDAHHLTDAQLLAMAREFYSLLQKPPAVRAQRQ